jgi:hypothetical protein
MAVKITQWTDESVSVSPDLGFGAKEVTTKQNKTRLENGDDSYVINTESYDQLKEQGKTDLQIFDYIDDIMRD